MDTNTKFQNAISRRELLKGTGALVISFSLLEHTSRLLAQQLPPPPGSSPYNNPDYLDPTSLDSWLAVMQDGSITVFTGKVDLGTGVETALAQMVAEELDVQFKQIHMQMGDTAKTVGVMMSATRVRSTCCTCGMTRYERPEIEK